MEKSWSWGRGAVAKGRKHATPSRKLLDLSDDSIPWTEFTARRDELFPADGPPGGFRFHGMSENAKGPLWDRVRGIARWHLIGDYRARQTALRKALSENLGGFAQDAKSFANKIEGMDADTLALLIPEIPDSESLFNSGDVRLGDLIDNLREFSGWCRMAKQKRSSTRSRPKQQAKQETINKLAAAWEQYCGAPTTTPNGPFTAFANFVASELGFTVSYAMIRTAVAVLKKIHHGE